MTSNLDRTELHRIQADGERQVLYLEHRLQAIVDKLVTIGDEIEDRRTCQIVLHLGRRGERDVVRAEWQKQG